jgi:ribosomal protein S18 acetylase RimI-like enzyme
MSTATAVAIRPAESADVDTVLAIWRTTNLEASITDEPASLLMLLEHDPTALLVAETDGRIVGTLIAAFDGWRGTMYRLAVLPDYRRRGIARALVLEGEANLRAKGALRAGAIVVHAKEEAVRFWNDAGYGRQEAVRRFVRTL